MLFAAALFKNETTVEVNLFALPTPQEVKFVGFS